MDIDQYVDLSYMLTGLTAAMEYEVQSIFQHEILVEAAASVNQNQRDDLQELYNKARTYIEVEHDEVKIQLEFIGVPDSLENYAEFIKQNTCTVLHFRMGDFLTEQISFSEAREILYEGCKNMIIDHVRNSFGGVS